MITGNEPAMPWNTTETFNAIKGGLTIRQHFAAMVMQGMLSSGGDKVIEDLARKSVIIADELIKELNKR